MTYTITVCGDDLFITIKVTGGMTNQSAMKFSIEAHARGQELGIDRYLMDLTEARNVDSVINNYKFAYQDLGSAPTISPTEKVAMLVSPDDHSHDFIETVVRNAGLDVTIFTDRACAERHLRE
jgi:hypothetical protein